jgi:hypothetical protein
MSPSLYASMLARGHGGVGGGRVHQPHAVREYAFWGGGLYWSLGSVLAGGAGVGSAGQTTMRLRHTCWSWMPEAGS